jgi:hypothetical protein
VSDRPGAVTRRASPARDRVRNLRIPVAVYTRRPPRRGPIALSDHAPHDVVMDAEAARRRLDLPAVAQHEPADLGLDLG